ncbi:SPOR domain-containing protein [Henriciella marina]|uniref:SPOR domain-containing protein n=1 Tax=Henriciella marina TaxID=453851 RepID=UPI00036E88A9|nr:SPOR domain-containing protein [Henriciella marina]
MALNASTGIRALVATTFLVSSCQVFATADPRVGAPIDFVRKTAAQQSHRTLASRSVSGAMPRPNPSAAHDTWRGPVTRTGSGTLPSVRQKIRFAYPGSVPPANLTSPRSPTMRAAAPSGSFTNMVSVSPSLVSGGTMTAGHASLPLNSLAHVLNPATGREIVVRISSRTSAERADTLALSTHAAEMLGVSAANRNEVEVSYLGPAPLEARTAPQEQPMTPAPRPQPVAPAPVPQKPVQTAESSGLFVQIGSFTKPGSASSVANRVTSGLPNDVRTVDVNGTTYHRVMVGPFRDRAAANRARSSLQSQGFRDGFVTQG